MFKGVVRISVVGLLVGLLVSVGGRPAIAAETADYEVVPCDVGAYIIDSNPAGLSVRSGPGAQYPVIATLSTDPEVPSDLTISGSAGEWMRINQEDYSGKKIVGWVYGTSLGLRAMAYGTTGAVVPLYEEMNTKSPVLTRLPSDTEVTIIACQGRWVKVNYNGVEGWLAPGSYCGASMTSCS